ncbi:unnamed protein product [Sphagnum troendelagicum]|uniref:Uncharacterized protein n=1 Tax=Sphagnum troendelagicum TaxID=128251 RepID=A0ABP0TWC0_9BRYO
MVLPVVGRPLTQVALSEGRRNWPFVFGFAFTLGLVIKLSTSLNPKDAQKSTFVNPNAHRWAQHGSIDLDPCSHSIKT